jgi:hypothetical protein
MQDLLVRIWREIKDEYGGDRDEEGYVDEE